MSEKLRVRYFRCYRYGSQRFISLCLRIIHGFEVVICSCKSEKQERHTKRQLAEEENGYPMPEGVKNLVVMNVNEVEKVAATVDLVFCCRYVKRSYIKKIEEEYAKIRDTGLF